ncbi:BMP family ABC transporter substrate-binding protein [Azospirillum sp. TSO22-1]|uniref:BMP family ABC transporter substrate-binding protein n=1 Tax=Azospirillum sp. TSO22-1 TaxID=716789 RepID=UPI000D605949|nr:BMP family ABC transporter substrate-binding protein [Azospirillum sp. TSO22-1]PWC53973.1 ABC transporter substrate-binding protein [Azospirillum sp. TSO22-1]
MVDRLRLSRRSVLKTVTAAGGLSALGAGLPWTPALAKDLVIGFVYVGPRDDFGYNQAHAEGAAAVKLMPGVKVLEEEKVPETVDVEKTMESMINLDGASLLFPTSFGYFDPHVLKEAKKHKGLAFLHCGGLWTKGKHPDNVGSYFGYIDEAQYLSGIVAGYASKTKKLGFVAAKPIPQVLRNINSFTLGARSVDPSITTAVIFTGDWSMPVKEAEATNSLIAQGVDVVTCHVDSPKVIVETAEKRGIYVTGYHANQAKLAPNGYLTGAEWNWAKVYTDYVKMVQGGIKPPNLVRGGLKEGIVKTSPYGAAVSDKARNHADDVKGQFMAGSFVVYKGPLKDNKGNIVIAAGTEHGQTDIALESMNWLVEGVVGSIA